MGHNCGLRDNISIKHYESSVKLLLITVVYPTRDVVYHMSEFA